MTEQISMVSPDQVKSGTLSWKPWALLLEFGNKKIRIELIGANNELKIVEREGDVALNLMRQLNTSNLTTRSLWQRIMDYLIAQGEIPAGTTPTVTGTPD